VCWWGNKTAKAKSLRVASFCPNNQVVSALTLVKHTHYGALKEFLVRRGNAWYGEIKNVFDFKVFNDMTILSACHHAQCASRS
jgi:hypothetical protein